MKKLLACSLTTVLFAIGFPVAMSAAGPAKALGGASKSGAIAQRKGKRVRVNRQRAPRRGKSDRRRGRVGRSSDRSRLGKARMIRKQRPQADRARNQRQRTRRSRGLQQEARARRARQERNRNDRIRRAQIERNRDLRRIRERDQEFRRVRRSRGFNDGRRADRRYRDNDRVRTRRLQRDRAIAARDFWLEREPDVYRRVRRKTTRSHRYYDPWDDRAFPGYYYGHPGRGWGVRAKARAFRGLDLARRPARPVVVVDRPYYVDYDDIYDGYYVDPYSRYYGRSDGFVFRVGSRGGDFFFSLGVYDRDPYIAIPYDRYAYAAYPYPVYGPVYRTYAYPSPAYRMSQTFSVNIAGTPVSYTRYEEAGYVPAYAGYGYAPVYAERGYYYDPWREEARFAIDPYADLCHPDLGYPDYPYYDAPVYYSGVNYSAGYFYDDGRDGRSFYRRHRNLVNIGLATGAGAAIGAILGGKRGAIIGAGVGAGAGAVYTYGIDPKDEQRYGI